MRQYKSHIAALVRSWFAKSDSLQYRRDVDVLSYVLEHSWASPRPVQEFNQAVREHRR